MSKRNHNKSRDSNAKQRRLEHEAYLKRFDAYWASLGDSVVQVIDLRSARYR